MEARQATRTECQCGIYDADHVCVAINLTDNIESGRFRSTGAAFIFIMTETAYI
jgi:hypothetical protein